MIVVTVVLMSAVTGDATELARMTIDNVGGTFTKRDYRVRTFRGRCTEALNRWTVQREGGVKGHKSPAVHIWHLIGKALAAVGYGPAAPAEITGDIDVQIDPAVVARFCHPIDPATPPDAA